MFHPIRGDAAVAGREVGWARRQAEARIAPTVADPKKGTITMIPEYGEDAPEREIREHDREDRELESLNPEDNEAHAAGQLCERCGAVITAGQDARLRADGRWVHEVCP